MNFSDQTDISVKRYDEQYDCSKMPLPYRPEP